LPGDHICSGWQAWIGDQHTDDHLAAGQVGKDGAPPGGAHAAGQRPLPDRGGLLQGGDRLHPPAAPHLDHEHTRGFQRGGDGRARPDRAVPVPGEGSSVELQQQRPVHLARLLLLRPGGCLARV